MKKLTECELENSQIITDLIKRIVSNYHTIVVINDDDNNMSTVYSFISSLEIENINIIFDDSEFCNLKHEPRFSGTFCRVQERITIKASNLGIYPCIKASAYPHLMFANIDFETLILIPKNIELALAMYLYNPVFSNLRCDRCEYSMICHKGCYVDNYIINKDFFQPILNNCNSYKSEIKKMIEKDSQLNKYIIKRREEVECGR